MRFHWLWDRNCRQHFRIYWRPGKINYANYWTTHHPEMHHKNIRKEFLTPTIVHKMLQIEQQQQQQVARAAWNDDDIFWGAQVVTNTKVEIWDHSSERMEFFSILSWRFGTRWRERMDFFPSSHKDLAPGGEDWFFFPSSHKDLAPGGDTHDPKCHKPQIGVPKMYTWCGCDDLGLARPDPRGTEDRLQSQAPLSCSTSAPSAHN